MSSAEDEVVTVAYPTERDRRIYEPGYFHAPTQTRIDQERADRDRAKFYAADPRL